MIKDSNTTTHAKTALINKIKECELEFKKFVRGRLGIVIHQQTNELNKTIQSACNKFNCSPQNYLHMLMTCSDDSPLLEHLIEGITIGETYFFRDKNQMELLKNSVLPELIKRKRAEENLTLRIWSAGCSSGEEIYTIAMLLLDAIPDIQDWTLQLLGTDINTKVLQKAIAGKYTEWSMRSIADTYKTKYFLHENNTYTLNQQILDLTNFSYLNLNDDRYPSMFNGTNAQDLILCRNVFIYFDNSQIDKFMHKFHNCLIPGGYLLLGASDPIQIENTHLIFHHHKGALFTRPLNEHEMNVKIVLEPIKTIIKPLPIQTPTQKNKIKISHKHAVSSINVNEDTITKLLNESQWQEVINIIEQYKLNNVSAFMLNAQATALANLGKLDLAIQICKQSIKIDPTNKYTYFTYALALGELNQLNDSEKAFRKTLFLDHQFVAGHFQLGLLLIRNKQQAAGLKSLKNALAIVHTKEPLQLVPGSQGLSYGRLTEILKHEIDLYNS